MNKLSWFLYLADVSGSMDKLLLGLAVISFMGGIILAVVGLVTFSGDCLDDGDWKAYRKVWTHVWLPVFFLGFIVGAFVPAKETVYAIAASELGESALTSETGGKAVQALNAWLDRQIAGNTTEE